MPTSDAMRKAAILVATLDPRAADELLDKMPAEVADSVRQLVMELDDVDLDEQNDVIREFMLAGGQSSDIGDAVELDPALREKIQSPNGYAEHHATAPLQAPFSFLKEATGSVLARHLERQHPQVIAVVAAHLQASQAAELIKHLSPRLQADVLRRVADLDVTDQEVLRDVEAELELLLSDDLRLAKSRQAGLKTVQTILNAAGSGRRELFVTLSNHQRDLATQLRQASTDSETQVANSTPTRHVSPDEVESQPASVLRESPPENSDLSIADSDIAIDELRDEPPDHSLISFEELTELGDGDWAILIRAVEPKIGLLALTGASELLLKRITHRLSKAESQALRTKLHQTGPLRLSDIEHAQQHVARLASRLAARGEIQLPERRGFAAAA